MAKRRKYGDAWKDVQIDAEQNDAVFDRFFKRTSHPSIPEAEPDSEQSAETAEAAESSPLHEQPPTPKPVRRRRTVENRPEGRATITQIDSIALAGVGGASDITSQVQTLRQHYRLSKGEAAILRQLLQRAHEAGASECYAKIPELADACAMTHRGCQFALKSLQDRDLIARVKNYDPANRLGILFLIKLPPL